MRRAGHRAAVSTGTERTQALSTQALDAPEQTPGRPLVWIGLLGPLWAGDQTRPRPVPAARQRSLLAALAVRAGDVVPADALAEAVWDGAPPTSWQVTIRNYVRRLRVVLGPDVGSRILTRPPGYLLQADANEVDVLSFEARCRAGRAAARAGDWQAASVMLSAAESLWRGTPFADVPSRRIRDAHLPYLEEMLLAAQEARIDADLRLFPSRAADVIPELHKLSGQHPERERLRSQLMLALYQADRQAHALSVYQTARKYSVAELGIEPGPGLQEMHRRILLADPALLPGQPAAAGRPG
jgi:DNA-binding SARP family transcriptional activator